MEGPNMIYQTEAKPQGWRAVAAFDDDRAECLLYLGRSSTQVRAGYAEAFLELLDDEDREHVTSIALQRWNGAPDASHWLHQTKRKMELPQNGEAVLHFFDGLQKSFPKMTDFERRGSGEYVLEEDREAGSYRWVSLETRRLCAGYVSPPGLDDADAHHERVLELA